MSEEAIVTLQKMKSYIATQEELDHINMAIKALGICDRIKVIIDSWAVDDDEYELLNQIADIIREEASDE